MQTKITESKPIVKVDLNEIHHEALIKENEARENNLKERETK